MKYNAEQRADLKATIESAVIDAFRYEYQTLIAKYFAMLGHGFLEKASDINPYSVDFQDDCGELPNLHVAKGDFLPSYTGLSSVDEAIDSVGDGVWIDGRKILVWVENVGWVVNQDDN